MKRRIASLFAGLALIASLGVAVASPGIASADENQDRCDELVSGAYYHTEQGNWHYADFLMSLAGNRGCDFGAIS
jgi:hypothetical protein